MAIVLLATRNPGKVREIQALVDELAPTFGGHPSTVQGPAPELEQPAPELWGRPPRPSKEEYEPINGEGAPGGIELVLPQQLGIELEVQETGQTYHENAALKALALCRLSGLVTLADDSGLEVEALGGAPGLHSARYSPLPGASDADRRALLLHNLQGLRRPWLAHFRCVVALAAPGSEPPRLEFYEGVCPGEIIPDERGENGFGYDPIFLLSELGSPRFPPSQFEGPGGKTMAELTTAEKNQLSHRARAVRTALPGLVRMVGEV